MYNHSKTIAMSLVAGALSLGLPAQQPAGIGWKTIEQVENNHAWLSSENAAGLCKLPSIHLSFVEGYANKINGDFVNYGGSDNALTLGALTESYYRLNERVVLYGLLDYYWFAGKHMAGSYFINPDDAPFNIVEYTDDNRGEKEMEHYHLAGAVSMELSDKIVLGGKLDYVVANYGKMKDLRHKNELMDLNASLGVILHLNPHLDLGTNLKYNRRVEGIYLDMYGKTDKTYNSLVDYGVFWGKKEQFGENGYTSDGEEKPLTDSYYGGSFQANWKVNTEWNLFNEVSASVRDGYYGKKSPSTVVFSNHSGNEYAYKGSLSFKSKKSYHIFQWAAQHKAVKNNENIYRYDNAGGGLTNVNYYGELETSDRKQFQAQVGYVGYWGMKEEMPLWITKGNISYSGRDIKSVVYPYCRKQQLCHYQINIIAERLIFHKDNACTLHIGGMYQKGNGEPYEDKMYAATVTGGNTPQSMQLYLMQEYEYFTAARMKGEVGIRYAHRINSSGLRVHASFMYGYTKAFDTKFIPGDALHELSFAIGCTF